MAKFKVGDRARIVQSNNSPDAIGKECIILDINVYNEKYNLHGDYAINVIEYPSSSEGYWLIDEHQLEPIIELGSWDEIQKSINWNPTKEVSYHD